MDMIIIEENVYATTSVITQVSNSYSSSSRTLLASYFRFVLENFYDVTCMLSLAYETTEIEINS